MRADEVGMNMWMSRSALSQQIVFALCAQALVALGVCVLSLALLCEACVEPFANAVDADAVAALEDGDDGVERVNITIPTTCATAATAAAAAARQVDGSESEDGDTEGTRDSEISSSGAEEREDDVVDCRVVEERAEVPADSTEECDGFEVLEHVLPGGFGVEHDIEDDDADDVVSSEGGGGRRRRFGSLRHFARMLLFP
jgi:hypothetical protein